MSDGANARETAPAHPTAAHPSSHWARAIGRTSPSSPCSPVASFSSAVFVWWSADRRAALCAEAVAVETAVVREVDTRLERVREARMKGYEGDSCGECGNFTLVRNGTCLKCATCGSSSAHPAS